MTSDVISPSVRAARRPAPPRFAHPAPRFVILRAAHFGMCFGVRDAIRLAWQQAEAGPVTVLGDLVHNQTVLSRLRERGIRIEQQVDSVATPTALITAHGASERRLAEARARGLNLVEATCPLVHVAHAAVRQLVREGYHPVIIGKRDHVEVRGMTEDLAAFDVVLSEADVGQLVFQARIGVAAQTTQPIERVRWLARLIRERFPAAEVRLVDTVCRPTKQRQNAAMELAQRADVVVVIGGSNSNNTRELVATCAGHCPAVHHVESAGDLRPEWFGAARTVGVTAGTSTPDDLIDEVEDCLRAWAEGRAPVGEGAGA